MLILFIALLFVVERFLPSLDNHCWDNGICEEGEELPSCPPCFEGICVVSQELCEGIGAYWNNKYKTCNFRKMFIDVENCQKAGGEWQSGICNFSKLCGNER